jgi:hypothetical protein
MFKKSLAALNIILGMATPINGVVNALNYAAPLLNSMSHTSRGKSGRVSSKPSGAAVLKRAAKKRNNIRKHN